jgi:hypothetical protein
MLRILKPSALAAFLASFVAIISLSGSLVSASPYDSFRSWEEMSTGHSLTYGGYLKFYKCFSKKVSVSLQYRNPNGNWKEMTKATTQKTSKCEGKFAAFFLGKVTALGQVLDDGIYLEMRTVSSAGKKYKSYPSAPILILEYKSELDRLAAIFDAVDKALTNGK